MDLERRRELIREYREAPERIVRAVEGMSAADLDRRPPDGTWSAREVVHHLADSEMRSALRLRQLIAEESPTIVAYDELLWSKRVYYDRPVEDSLLAFRAARSSTAGILERMSEADWAREGTHTESGRYTPEIWLEIYAAHGRDHLAQLLAAAAGKRPG